MKVTEIMSRPVIAVTPATSVKEAARILVEKGISALPVLDARGGLVGILSEADLMPIETRPDPRSQATPLPPSAGSTPPTVSEVMTRNVVTVPADCEVSQAARVLLEAGVKRVPVVHGRRVLGIVSRRDLMRVIARDDALLRADVTRRLRDLGIPGSRASVNVKSGIATVELDEDERRRRLVETVALEVPGVLEVRFSKRRGD